MNKDLNTLNKLSKSTTSGLCSIQTALRIISKSQAQSRTIHHHTELGIFTLFHQKVSAEVVQPISTRGNCEDSSGGDIPAGVNGWICENKMEKKAERKVSTYLSCKILSTHPCPLLSRTSLNRTLVSSVIEEYEARVAKNPTVSENRIC